MPSIRIDIEKCKKTQGLEVNPRAYSQINILQWNYNNSIKEKDSLFSTENAGTIKTINQI